MPRLLPVLVVVLAFAGCSRKTEPASDAPAAPPSAAPVAASPIEATAIDAGVDDNPLDWTTLSADAKTELEQKGKPDGSCVLTARRDGKTLWSGDRCLAKRADMRFLSKDGERFVVLHPVPEGSSTDWQHTEVAHVYRRTKPEWTVLAGGVIQDPSRARISGTSLEWLRGTLATPGRPPRYSPDGNSVEFETIEGQKQEIPLVPKKR